MLEGTHLTLEKVQEIARSFEAVDIQLKAMTSVEKLIASSKEKPLTGRKGKKRKPDVIVVTERVILVVTVVVRRETLSVRGVTR